MAKFIYRGPDEAFEFRGIKFLKGEPFETDDDALAAKLACMVEFGGKSNPNPPDITTAGPRRPNPEPTKEAASPDEALVAALDQANKEIARLRDEAERMTVERDDYRAQVADLEARLMDTGPEAAPEPEAVENEADEEDVPEPTEGTDWRDLHWKQRVKMARDLGAEVTKVEDADDFLMEHFG